ncbi:uncharacterized protein LOC133805965 [Humulus lupulus]|uniref:uncharacterized protein LOC133805965 n=1 Tax=Humulus lupulus TaxID=3486 RepID=UPI002B40E8B4|nr:uncharacterized protein LOC133805965 [Humulus lupulus]
MLEITIVVITNVTRNVKICIRFLLQQGLEFHGHDESQDSSNAGNFLELLTLLVGHNEEVRVVALNNAPENLRLTSLKIQEDIVNACATETINFIIKDMGDVIFSILVDESRDVSIKEQMVVMFHYVDKKGLRDQGYDGASNMSGEFNSLKSIIMKENESAFSVHCLNSDQKHEATTMLQVVQTYDFVFSLHLVKNILGITNELTRVLQKGDQYIVNAMDLVKVCKEQLQMMTDNGWNSLVEEVSNFCVEFNIDVLNMDDLQLQELNSCFNEANTEMLLCLACLSPNSSFSAFDKGNLICLAQLYPRVMSAEDPFDLYSQTKTTTLASRKKESRKHPGESSSNPSRKMTWTEDPPVLVPSKDTTPPPAPVDQTSPPTPIDQTPPPSPTD